MSKRILVTGGAGFLGSHLCDRLIERGDEVICLDNFFTGTRSNIAHLIDHKQFSVIEHDIIEPAYIDVDQIYNLACPAAPGHYQSETILFTPPRRPFLAPGICLVWQHGAKHDSCKPQPARSMVIQMLTHSLKPIEAL